MTSDARTSPDTVVLVSQGRPTAVIALGRAATHVETHAARELQRYIRAATGALLPIAATDEANAHTEAALVLVGRAETNPAIASLVADGSVVLSAEEPGLDGFVMQTVVYGSTPALVLGGSCDRGTLYAVYDFLERCVGVGFFWDEERVPPAQDLILRPIRISNRPRFALRECPQPCVFSYSTAWWGLDDWKREIDWAAKHKMNCFYLPLPTEIPWKRTMAKFGVSLGPETEAEWAAGEMYRQLMAYARSLGMDTIGPGFQGVVPAAFKEAHPGARYVEVRWLDFPPYYSLYPTDPLFKEVGCTFIREYNSMFGTSHLYNPEPYGEVRPGADDEERSAIKTDFARAVAEMIAAVDPEGTWFCTSWAFRDGEFWPKEAVQRFMEAIPNDRFLVGDLWCEERPLYEELEYFWGRRWGFAILHSFGGNRGLHGDLAQLIRRAQEVTLAPRASRCEAFMIMPEVIHHNHLYYDLATRLAWDPGAVELDAFLHDYARRRYGAEHGPAMARCLAALAESVYGWNDLIPSLYQVRPDTDWALKGARERIRFLPGLRRALALALECAGRLADNTCYRHDLIDITKEYVGLLYSEHFLRLVDALSAQDRVRLKDESRTLVSLLDAVERLLASDEAYRLAPIIERAHKVPGSAPDVERHLRQILTTLGSYAELLDYARWDLYELIRYYYRPRAERYLRAARKAATLGKKAVEAAETDEQAREIARQWIEEGFPVRRIRKPDTIAVVQDIASRLPLT